MTGDAILILECNVLNDVQEVDMNRQLNYRLVHRYFIWRSITNGLRPIPESIKGTATPVTDLNVVLAPGFMSMVKKVVLVGE